MNQLSLIDERRPQTPSGEPARGPNKRGYMSFQPAPFDYSQLAGDVASAARASAERIRSHQRKLIIETGQELLRMKETLAHGHFTEWVDRALNFSPATARNYMAAARELADKPLTVSVLPPSLVYRLAGAPEPIRTDIVTRIEAGELFDRDEVQEIILKKRAEAQEAKKTPELRKKEAEAKRRRLRNREAEAKRWDAEQRETAVRENAVADEIVASLRAHYDHHDEIYSLLKQWETTTTHRVKMRLLEAIG